MRKQQNPLPPKRIISGDSLDKVSVLSNLEGGLDAVGYLLDVDPTDLESGILAGGFDRYTERQVSEGFRNLEDSGYPNYDALEQAASRLHSVRVDDVPDLRDQNLLRIAIADGAINLNDFESGALIFKDLTQMQLEKLLDYYEQHRESEESEFSLNDMFEMYFADDGDIMNTKESFFWAWFREIFYA